VADPDWLEELASAMESGRGTGTDDDSELLDWGEGLVADLRSEPNVTAAPVVVPSPEPVAEPAPVTLPSPDTSAIEARLARIESLMDADLDKLGPAVLVESIGSLDAEIDALGARLAQLDAPAVAPAAPPAPDADAALELVAALQELQQVVGRIDERQVAQSRFLTDALEARLEAIAAQVEVLSGRQDPSRAIGVLARRMSALEAALLAAVEANGHTDQHMSDLIERLDRLTAGLLG
jgi:hypothetical protein